MRFGLDALRILHFDCEARPGAWIGSDYCSRSLTAIAWRFRGEAKTYSTILDRTDTSTRRLLEAFLPAYDVADMVTFHFGRSFDMPLLNHELQDNQMPLLGQKLTVDTKLDLAKGTGGSKSQENLAASTSSTTRRYR